MLVNFIIVSFVDELSLLTSESCKLGSVKRVIIFWGEEREMVSVIGVCSFSPIAKVVEEVCFSLFTRLFSCYISSVVITYYV